MTPVRPDLHEDDPTVSALAQALREGGGPVMGLSRLDGFLTALAIGPEPVAPAEWLPLLWEDESPHFETPATAGAFVEALLARVNAILAGLDRDPEGYSPVLDVDADGTQRAESWAEGFLDGMSLRPDAWEPLVSDDEDGLYLAPVLALCTDEDGHRLMVDDDAADAALDARATALIGPCMAAVRTYWRLRRAAAPRPGQGPSPRPGRNAPCPCGSGKKYKHCCGARDETPPPTPGAS